MSNKAIEQALAHLIPTHADALPPQIVSLASSLYVQSRHHGSALKPEEEIARPFACAEIACKRLSRTLRLPPLIGRPPCPPRMYGRIYKYIEGALAKASVIRKPSANRNAARRAARAAQQAAAVPAPDPAPSPQPLLPKDGGQTVLPDAQGTPTPNGPIRATPSRGVLPVQPQPIPENHTSIDAPSWTMPMIRNICKVQPGEKPESRKEILAKKKSPTSFLAPHMFTGISSMLSDLRRERIAKIKGDAMEEEFLEPVGQWVESFYHYQQRQKQGQPQPQDIKNEAFLSGCDDGVVQHRLMTLMVSLYVIIWSRFLTNASKDADPVEIFIEISKSALAVIGLYCTEHVDEIDVWLYIIMQKGWTQGREWFDNIPLSVENDIDESQKRGAKTREALPRENGAGANGEADQPKGGLLPGLATMMQDKLDFLNEERRQKYANWKEGVMQRISELEKEAALN
ncbi:hypothetical protein KEM56_005335 [Ascosphaera pollenicola]|nr:hypothetical protein KEM56_005335 [Ascosphaera pollenicola]